MISEDTIASLVAKRVRFVGADVVALAFDVHGKATFVGFDEA